MPSLAQRLLVLCILTGSTPKSLYTAAFVQAPCRDEVTRRFSRVDRGKAPQRDRVADPSPCVALHKSLIDTDERNIRDIQSLFRVESVIFSFPILMALTAFVTHQSFALGFHAVCDTLTETFWDRSTPEVLDVVRAGLNAPVVTSIAILFGTLAANTINTLIDKNSDILRCGILMGEAVRTARCTFDSFSKDYRDAANTQLDAFVDEFLRNFWADKTNIVTLRQLSPHIEKCTRCIHRVGRQADSNPGAAVGEAYVALQRIKDLQGDLMAATQRKFPWFHYANLCTLGASTCVIFLIDTDPDTVNFAAEPQLALGWSMLVGTLSMLAVVVYDLNSPIAGITRVSDCCRSQKTITTGAFTLFCLSNF